MTNVNATVKPDKFSTLICMSFFYNYWPIFTPQIKNKNPKIFKEVSSFNIHPISVCLPPISSTDILRTLAFSFWLSKLKHFLVQKQILYILLT